METETETDRNWSSDYGCNSIPPLGAEPMRPQ